MLFLSSVRVPGWARTGPEPLSRIVLKFARSLAEAMPAIKTATSATIVRPSFIQCLPWMGQLRFLRGIQQLEKPNKRALTNVLRIPATGRRRGRSGTCGSSYLGDRLSRRKFRVRARGPWRSGAASRRRIAAARKSSRVIAREST